MDLALNNLQRLMCHKTQLTNQRVQNLDEVVCISHGANTLGKCRNLIILRPGMVKSLATLSYSTSEWQPAKEKENSEFKLVKIRLKNDLLVQRAG